MNAIEVRGLRKSYVKGFKRKKVSALHDISFTVSRGDVFGFLGPNGAGKTTTIRILMGLIKKDRGSAKIFGDEIPSRAARFRLGFLPEAPYFYDYLSVTELLEFTGRLFGQTASIRAKRIDELIELVGLQDARKSPVKSYSKGMMQRAGIAQALMNDPELVVLDEPMSGLDPIGRKDVRDIVLSLKDAGKTVFFSSHILSDVESIADRIAILIDGRMKDSGALQDIVSVKIGTEVVFNVENVDRDGQRKMMSGATSAREHGNTIVVMLDASNDLDEFVRGAHSLGGRLISVVPVNETLEDVFVRAANEKERLPI